MKYRLSTILLLITCVALGLGWYVDRQNRRPELIAMGARNWSQSISLRFLDTAKPAELAETIERQQLLRVYMLFHSSDGGLSQFFRSVDRRHPRASLESKYAYRYAPTKLAAGILDALHCTSFDQYFERLMLLDEKGELGDYRPGGEQYEPFRQFVEKALESSN